MLNVFKNERKKRTLLTLAALLTALALLISCSPQGGKEETPSASASITDTIAESSSTAPVPTESETAVFEDPEDDKAVFEGVVGQSWYAFDIPLFQEMGRARDLAYGAGQLWVVGIQRGVDDDSFSTPPLMVSRDAFNWERVDLSALGLPEDLSGEARLLGNEKEIIVIFENPGGMKTNGDKPQNKPWILRGDGENWQVISDESFGAWEENNRGSGKFLHYWDLNAFSLYEDDLILMPNVGWFEPYSTSDQALSLGRVSSDGKAQLVADKAGFQSDYYHQRVNSMLNY